MQYSALAPSVLTSRRTRGSLTTAETELQGGLVVAKVEYWG